MKKLKFRRQFLLSPKKTEKLLDWKYQTVGGHHLYTHPDLETYNAKGNEKNALLLGHVLDPKMAERTTEDILNTIAEQKDEEGIAKELYGLVGRFILMIVYTDHLVFFNDACGLKSFYYTTYKDQLYIASQPLLLGEVTTDIIHQGDRYRSFFESEYLKKSKESWYPSGTSLYEGVTSLAPNHYLTTKTLEQIRYWPTENHQINDFETSLEKFATLLQKTLIAGSKKYNLALGVTGGFDSRIILSATKPVKEKILYYTLQYRHLNKDNSDIWIPLSLKNKLGINHQIMDCRMTINEEFKHIYLQNSDMAHLDDWGFIAYGISKNLPEGSMAIKGSCSETGRCYFYKSGKHPVLTSSEDILNYNPSWKGIPFIEKRIADWYTEVKDPKVNKGYKILDLFHWEVSTGSWQTQNQLEWDIVHDTFTPFNNRELLDIMLRIDPKYRSKPDNYILYQRTMEKLWPEVLSEPINPPSGKELLKSKFKAFMVKLGVEKYNH